MSFWTGFVVYSVGGLPKGLISIIIISFLVVFLQTLAYKLLSNQARIKQLKERQKALNAEIKANINNKEKIEKLNKELMQSSLELMKLSMKPLLFTSLPILLILWGLKASYSAAGVGNIISWGVNLPIIGDGAGWLLSFIIFSTIFGLILRKILKVY
ncbi:MAG: EMC3/TMCO1 family protein [Candidatus Pacearchaeota archaeon]